MPSAPDSARPRGRPAKADTHGRDALLRAAVTAFARHGFDGADLRGIAAAAGVTANLVRVHFGGKDGLWTACVERLAEDIRPGLTAVAGLADDERPLPERLRDAVSVLAAFYDHFPDVRDFVVRIAAENADRAAFVTARILRPAYEAGRPLLAEGMAAGIIRASHPAMVFVLLNSVLNQPPQFPALLTLLTTDIAPAEARAHLIETVLSTLLHEPGALPAADAADAPQKGQP